MREINLREFYPEIYKEDYVVSLPDEVVEVLLEFMRGDTAYRVRTYRYKAYYSLDCGDNIEREMLHYVPSVQEIIERNMEEEKLYAALDQLTEKQRKRVYAHYILGIKQSYIDCYRRLYPAVLYYCDGGRQAVSEVQKAGNASGDSQFAQTGGGSNDCISGNLHSDYRILGK